MSNRPNIYIITGPNGAGKTTFAEEFLPHYARCRTFVNADTIARGLSAFSPDAAALKAGRLLLEQIEAYADKRIDFAFETTLSGVKGPRCARPPARGLKPRAGTAPDTPGKPGVSSAVTYLSRLKDLKKEGYRIHLFFLWIPDVKLSLARVAYRVKMGGHGISEKVVRRRFHKGIKNFFKWYKPILDSWMLFDNSGGIHHPIVKEKDNRIEIFNQKLYDQILKSAEAS